MIVAIDGPAGAGKSTVARALARELGFTYLDSGAMYRTVALVSLEPAGDLSRRSLGVLEARERDGPVHRAAVEIGEAQLVREGARDRRLAGPGGAVDRDDHRRRRSRSAK